MPMVNIALRLFCRIRVVWSISNRSQGMAYSFKYYVGEIQSVGLKTTLIILGLN